MYLAVLRRGDRLTYRVRRSYYDAGRNTYGFQEIFDLGVDPARYMYQLGDNAICFDEHLEKAVNEHCECDPSTFLELLLWDFLPMAIRRNIEKFQRKPVSRLHPMSFAEQQELRRSVHLFDRRRLFYIRYKAVDQSRLYRVNDKLYRPLLYTSRDEKEYYFREQEKCLGPDELKQYVYVIFNLQKHFDAYFSAFMPEALDEAAVTDVFLEELCRLNNDQSFWQDDKERYSLHSHLQGYVIAFFDTGFTQPSFDRDFYQSFRNRHRRFRWPAKNRQVSEEQTSAVFEEKLEKLKSMNRMELTRLFRRRAKQLHPDSGGRAEDFITLLNAYKALKQNASQK